MAASEHAGLSAEEAKVYDRQLRLWGVEAQQRMTSASILVVGMSGLMSELCKNVVLAGVRSMTIADHAVTCPLDLAANVLFESSHVGRARAEAALERLGTLNPHVELRAHHLAPNPDQRHVETLDLIQNKGPWRLVIVSDDESPQRLSQLNAAVRAASTSTGFISLHSGGSFGWFFVDFGPSHVYRIRPAAASASVTAEPESIEKSISYSPMGPTWFLHSSISSCHPLMVAYATLLSARQRAASSILTPSELMSVYQQQLSSHFLTSKNRPSERHFAAVLQSSQFQVAPLTAVLGGLIGQEVIKFLTQLDAPVVNSFWFDAKSGENAVEVITPS